VRELRGFERVALQPGEKKTVTFKLGPSELGMLDENWKWVVEPGQFQIFLGNSSDAPLVGTLEVR